MNKKSYLFYASLAALIILGGLMIWSSSQKSSKTGQAETLKQQNDNANTNNSTSKSLAQEITSGEALLLDVRTYEEYQNGHFENAQLLPVDEISAGKNPDVTKDFKIYIYCRSGNRSATATAILKSRGFSNISDLGGLSDVRRLGLQITEPAADAVPILP